MELFNETKEPLQKLWQDGQRRLAAKLVITEAIGQATSLTVKEAQEVMTELDRLLLEEDDSQTKQTNPGL